MKIKVAIVLFVLLGSLIDASAQITSTFDTDSEGWTFVAAATPQTVVWNASNGNPAGFASVTYSSNTGTTVQNWIAPSKFLGNHLLLSLGMQLKFDLQQSIAGTGAGFDVIIRNGGSNMYISGVTPKPAVAPAWTPYAYKLDETGGWFVSGLAATRSQVRSILANVTSIEIRGTYGTNAAYKAGLDNVVLEQRLLPAAPAVSSISATSGKPGDVITINGAGFDTDKSLNKVFFGPYAGIEAQVQSATATQLTVVVPAGAVHGQITITNTITGLTSKSAKHFSPVFDGGGSIIPASFKPKFTMATIQNEGWFTGDFDGDGWEDFAITNNNTDDVVDIYRNLGAGGTLSAASFAPKVSIPAPATGGSGTNGAGLWFVDIDGDGKKDMITSNSLSAFAAAYLTFRNTSTPGNISFAAPQYWGGGSDETPPYFIGDIDGDGRVEFVSGEGSSGAGVNLFISQNLSTPGNVEIGPPVGYFSTTVDAPSEITMGDLNNDGKPDMIASWNFGDRFSVIQNNSTPGNLNMTDMGQVVTGQYNRSLKIVDVDLDGKNDLIWKQTGGAIYIRLNTDTDGVLTVADFATEFILTTDLGANGGIAFVDFNGDGKVDLASTDLADVGVSENIFSGGAFSASAFVPAYQILGTGGFSGGPAVADFNRDGKPDLIMGASSSITIVENNNVAGPQISVNTVSPLRAPVDATVTITGKNFSTVTTNNHVYFGAVEATVLSATETEIKAKVPGGAAYGGVSVRKGELTSKYRIPFNTIFSTGVNFNSAHFGAPVNFTFANANYDIEVGDMNKDGKPDLLVEGNGGFIFRNTHNTGAISTSSLLPDDTLNNSFLNPRLEDLDGDGLPDAASVNGIAHKNNSTSAEIDFLPFVSLALGGSTMDIADLNQDGKPDLAVTVDASGAVDLSILENRTANLATNVNFATGTYGSFSGSYGYTKAAPFGGIVMEDFDGDGVTDLVTTNTNTDNISIYHNVGALRVGLVFTARVEMAVGDQPGRVYKGDFDRDGKVDLVLYHAGTSATLLIVLQNTSTPGNISFSRIDLTNPSAVTVAAVADLDGDGKPEILANSEAGNRISIYKNVHTTGVLSAASFAAPFNLTVTGPRGLATGDINLDGKPEIIITRAAGLLVVYENLIVSNLPTITSFTSTSGPIGTTVVITGTNFSTTPSANAVTFNGVTAVVTASSATTITATVPTGASTGRIEVSVGGNAATSATDFVVTASPVLTIAPQPASPAGVCEGTNVTLNTSATGTTNITYKWQFSTTATGTFADINDGSGYSNTATATLTINTTGNFGAGFYRCRINGDLAAEVITNVVAVTVNAAPAKPVITSSVQTVGNTVTLCTTAALTLTAPAGFANYTWSNAATTAVLGVTTSGNYSVVVKDVNGCSSASSDAITVSFSDALCPGNPNNPNNPVDPTDPNPSTPDDIEIYNAVSPNGDNKNDFFLIRYIEQLPDTRSNTVSIFNRWGDLVFEVKDYNNADRVFRGLNKNGNELPAGTYYYKIKFSGSTLTGYLSLKR